MSHDITTYYHYVELMLPLPHLISLCFLDSTHQCGLKQHKPISIVVIDNAPIKINTSYVSSRTSKSNKHLLTIVTAKPTARKCSGAHSMMTTHDGITPGSCFLSGVYLITIRHVTCKLRCHWSTPKTKGTSLVLISLVSTNRPKLSTDWKMWTNHLIRKYLIFTILLQSTGFHFHVSIFHILFSGHMFVVTLLLYTA